MGSGTGGVGQANVAGLPHEFDQVLDERDGALEPYGRLRAAMQPSAIPWQSA